MNLAVIGSTGSIGKQTLEIVRKFPEQYSVTALCARKDWETLLGQILTFKPQTAAVADEKSYEELKKNIPSGINTKIICGNDSSALIAGEAQYDLAVISTVGISGLNPVINALARGKQIALATKEALVAAGKIVMNLAREKNITIRPIDSEHSAILQCIRNEKKYLEKIILTSSGGPFRGKKNLSGITKEQVLAHPTWKMGNKITVDSATLMNKGFEVIEAAFLFEAQPSQIEVVVHPQSIIHSLVEFYDGSVLAQLSPPDMRLAIQYALSMPHRIPNKWSTLNLAQIGTLTFENPDTATFPCLNYAYEALRIGKTMPAAINGANEEAVNAFLDDEIEFTQIPVIIETVLQKHNLLDENSLDNILEADSESRRIAREEINKNRVK